jgi:hypothetical protein
MSKIDDYRHTLRTMVNWEPYLLAESRLPGPRGNLELAQAVADEGNRDQFEHFLTYTPDWAPQNTPGEFLAFCGALGLGKLVANGERQYLPRLRSLANDPRWRMREAVAMALQRLGDVDMPFLLNEMQVWSQGTLLEQRAAAAALCEPRLLKRAEDARAVLSILDRITASLESVQERKTETFQALRKGLDYCWSVAVAALPEEGKPLMEKWLASRDKDILWIMKENLKKQRLTRMDEMWVERWKPLC